MQSKNSINMSNRSNDIYGGVGTINSFTPNPITSVFNQQSSSIINPNPFSGSIHSNNPLTSNVNNVSNDSDTMAISPIMSPKILPKNDTFMPSTNINFNNPPSSMNTTNLFGQTGSGFQSNLLNNYLAMSTIPPSQPSGNQFSNSIFNQNNQSNQPAFNNPSNMSTSNIFTPGGNVFNSTGAKFSFGKKDKN